MLTEASLVASTVLSPLQASFHSGSRPFYPPFRDGQLRHREVNVKPQITQNQVSIQATFQLCALSHGRAFMGSHDTCATVGDGPA